MGTLKLIRTISDLRAALGPERRAGRRIGLVPTMGYLHRGHMALVDRARTASDIVVVTIFVNPTQFGPNEDLATYPRDLDADMALCRQHGVDLVFAPEVGEMYPEPMQTVIDVVPLSTILIGIDRPGHFQGVATVVAKLFNIAQPDMAFFGEKDFQQLTVVRRMVRDLSMPIEIVGVPTVREADGLAASSRNVRLTPEDRQAAAAIARGLDLAEAAVAGGESDPRKVLAVVRDVLADVPQATIRSLDLRHSHGLGTVERIIPETLAADPLVVLITVRFGDVLLIDQREIAGGGSATSS